MFSGSAKPAAVDSLCQGFPGPLETMAFCPPKKCDKSPKSLVCVHQSNKKNEDTKKLWKHQIPWKWLSLQFLGHEMRRVPHSLVEATNPHVFLKWCGERYTDNTTTSYRQMRPESWHSYIPNERCQKTPHAFHCCSWLFLLQLPQPIVPIVGIWMQCRVTWKTVVTL